MNQLIIITGVSGCGKSTIARHLHHNVYENSTLISMDKLKENIYEIAGFHNASEKHDIDLVVYDAFLDLLDTCMSRKDEHIIIEYPFNKDMWEHRLQYLVSKYKYTYEAITIQVKVTDYDVLFDRLNKRNNSSLRHPSHSLTQYDSRLKYKSSNELGYDELKKDYDAEIYTSISIGKIIEYYNDDNNDITQLVTTLTQ